MDMCVVVSSDRISELPKSSKGTVQRGVANEVYRNEIQQMYSGQETSIQSLPKRNLTEVQEWILEAVQTSTGTPAQSAPLDISTDLFSWGVDSVRAARIRARMQKVGGTTNVLNHVLISIESQYRWAVTTPKHRL